MSLPRRKDVEKDAHAPLLPFPYGKKRLAVPSMMRVVVGVIAIVIRVVVFDAAVDL